MKKLLAIVMAAAMILSMSVIASADATADIVYADGTATITVYDSQIAAVDYGVVYPEGVTCKKAAWAKAFKDACDDGENTLSGIGNKAATDASGNTYAVFTAACMTPDGDPIPYDGALLTFEFEGVTEGTEFVIVSGTAGASDVKANTVTSVAATAPTAAPTEVPTEVPTAAPTANATEKPVDKATDAPKSTTAPTTTTQPSNAGKVNAGKTADVAPVATMITLVVVAGVAIVSLKKKATN